MIRETIEVFTHVRPLQWIAVVAVVELSAIVWGLS